MGISVNLCHNSSPVEKIGKTIDTGESFDCVLKADTSILRPTIIINTDSANIPGYNYMEISSLGRSYFIDDIVSKNNKIWEISGHVDVLETYSTAILSNSAVIKRQSALYNTYLNDPEWKVYAYEKVVAYKFTKTPFSKDLKYLLTVAGA